MLKLKKRAIFLIVLVLSLIISVSYGVYYTINNSPTAYRVDNSSYSSSKLPKEFDGFKIGYLSDINLTDSKSITRFKEVVNDLNKQEIDLVIFGGDIYDSSIFDNAKVTEIFKSIKADYGKFAVLGERDFIDSSQTQSILNEGGFEVLHNEGRSIYYKGQSICLFGLENNGDCSTLINDGNKDKYKLVAVHQPDYFNLSSTSNINLQLSGHTMGGLINLPLYGSTDKPNGGTDYTFGSFTSGSSHLLISNGVSMASDKSFRLFTENEINIVTLNYKSN